MDELICIAINLDNGVVADILNYDKSGNHLRIISQDHQDLGSMTLEKCQPETATVFGQNPPAMKRPAPKIPSMPKSKKVLKPPTKSNPKEQPEYVNGSSDYAILSAASSKVDTSTLISVVQNLRTNEKEYRCSFCQYVSKCPRNARRHVEMKHVDTGVVFRCKVCPSTAKLKATLKNHYMKVHQMPDTAAKAMVEET